MHSDSGVRLLPMHVCNMCRHARMRASCRKDALTARWLIPLDCIISRLTLLLIFRNHKFVQYINPDYLKDPGHCPAAAHGRVLLDDDDVKPTYFLQAAGVWTGLSVVAAGILGLLALLLFRHRPHSMVYTTVSLQVGALATTLRSQLTKLAGKQDCTHAQCHQNVCMHTCLVHSCTYQEACN